MGKRVYSGEFKRGAVEQVILQRCSMRSVAGRLGLKFYNRGRGS